jgi:hypothetical protein
MKIFPVVVVLFAAALHASASKEGILALSSFRLESAGIGSSGKVVVEGNQDEKNKIVGLKISAFGKDYVVPEDKLTALSGLRSNGVRISYEAGQAELGGRTIYIQFQMGFTTGAREQALVTLTEDGKVEVSRTKMKGAKP